MEADSVRSQLRREIVARSVQILRQHNISNGEIRHMILRDFHIDGEALDAILRTGPDAPCHTP